MRYSKENLVEIARDELIEDRIEGDIVYDWLDIIGIPQRPSKLDKSLYFASYSSGEGGWDNGFDRRQIAKKVAMDTARHLVVDGNLDLEGTSYLKVQSLENFLRRIYENAKIKNKPYVIGVTGSVGKTTTVAFLEHLLQGETSGGGRLWSWFETMDGNEPWFMVEEINFADEDPQGFKDLLEKVFSCSKTYVLDTPVNRTRLPVRANFVSSTTFRYVLFEKAKGYIVYHKALSTRQPCFNPSEYLKQRW